MRSLRSSCATEGVAMRAMAQYLIHKPSCQAPRNSLRSREFSVQGDHWPEQVRGREFPPQKPQPEINWREKR
ncbi:hypothetical protein J6590_000215 [Homalodisca vitripennis]|nr:hypothetical protein J6590_000215 [Homalodisca vitripennis]